MPLNAVQVLSSSKLPTLPSAAIRLLQLVGAEDPKYDEICQTIMADPALAARVLQTANSAYFGLRTRVTTLDRAAFLLGPATLASFCLTFSLASQSLPGGSAAEGFRSYWLHSLLQGLAAETIAKYDAINNAGSFFVNGLLLDIGRLAILKAAPDEYQQVLAQESTSDLDVVSVERNNMGIDHIEIGMALCQKWNLPEVFCNAIEYHHASANQILALKDFATYPAIRVTALASSMCDFILYGQSARSHSRTITLARDIFDFDDDTTRTILTEIRTKSESLPDEYRIDVRAVPPMEEILTQANDMLATMSLSAQAEAERVRATKVELETKNRSLELACERLEKRATFDHLTELYNRAFLDAYLSKHLRPAHRSQLPVGVILCDIDRFKNVNDTYGHQFGDAVLHHVAQVLKASVSEEDVVARYGGEEFVVATTTKAADEVIETAERIRANVEQASLDHAGIRINITLSAGVSTTDEQPSDALVTAEALIAAADKAMYAAKALGRNRVQTTLTGSRSGPAGPTAQPIPELDIDLPSMPPVSTTP